ncbi:putative methyltransferase-domain-containing protein [Linnemannia elongata]|nr:putative methyltransferase-domain-containing protein [Linnemannia elongata]
MLMIEGPKFSSFDFSSSSQDGEPFEINGHRIILPPKEAGGDSTKDIEEGEQSDPQDTEEVPPPPLSHTASTAKSVWDCSIVLGKYLETLANKTQGFWTDKRVLELGAGQGIVSLSAAALGAERVIMTDIDSAVPALQRGARLNGFQAPQVQVTALDWTNRSQALQYIWNDLLASLTTPSSLTAATTRPQLDYILASDVIWVDYLVQAFVETVADLMHISKERRDSGTHHHVQLSSSQDEQTTTPLPQPPVLLLAYQFRSTRSDQLLFDSLDQLGLQRKKITLDGDNIDDQDSVYMDSQFRKPNLAIWKVWKE